MNRLLFKNATFSVVQTIVSALLLFFLYRFLLHTLGAEQLGIWAVVLASTSVARLSDMGLSGAALKFVARNLATGNREAASHVVQTASLSIGAVLAVLLVAIYPLLKVILTWVIPANALGQAILILPWAVLSLWFGMIAGIFQSALDGCNRMDIRNIILIVCNCLYLAGAFWLVPNYGLEGLAKGQFAQSVALAVLNWLAIRSQLQSSPWIPCIWKRNLFKEMFKYALNFQIASVAAMLFDPVTKFLLTKFGGLSETAFYEMASQVILKARTLLIAGFQAVVPVIAGVDNSDHARLLSLYRKSYRVLSFFSLPYFVGIGLALPLISILWIGHIEVRFVAFGSLLCIGWMLSNVGVPAYFHNIGTGHLSFNTVVHLQTGLLNLTLGAILGAQYGGYAVVSAAMFSLALPNVILAFRVQKRLGVSPKEIIPSEHRQLYMWVILGAIVSCVIYFALRHGVSPINLSIWGLSAYIAVASVAIWVHPYRKEIIGKFVKHV